jgi:NAD(P)-dependent dehydrogenase (short-subunit alcohol dehydrogenase family)
VGGPGIGSLKPDSSLTELRSLLWQTDSEFYTHTFAVNTTATFFSVIAFLDLLDKGNKQGNVQQSSQVIATSSIAAYNRVALAGFAYGGSKAATTLLMKQFSTLFIPYGIRSNVVAPGCKFSSHMVYFVWRRYADK